MEPQKGTMHAKFLGGGEKICKSSIVLDLQIVH